MHLLNGKLQCLSVSDMIERPRIYQLMEESFSGCPVLLLYGAGGIGKTAAVGQFLKNHVRKNFGYYSADGCDGEEGLFLDYLIAMLKNAGIRGELDREKDAFAVIRTAFDEMETGNRQFYLAFDQMDRIEDERIWEIMRFLLSYVPQNCSIFLICGIRIQAEIMQLILKKRVGIFPVSELAFSEKEISRYFESQDIVLGSEQIAEIRRVTGGWCTAMHTIVLSLQMHKAQGDILHVWENPLLDYYIQKNFWENCTDSEKEILLKGSYFSYLTVPFIEKVLEISNIPEHLMHLENTGFLRFDMYEQRYYIEEMLLSFIQRNVKREAADQERALLIRACCWYDANGYIREALQCMLKIGEQKSLENYLMQHMRSILHMLNAKELKACLNGIDPDTRNPVFVYMRGWIAFRENDRKRAAHAWNILEEQYQAEPGNRRRIGELMLNLLYENPDVSILQWLDTAEEYLPEIGQITLFSYTADIPSIRLGVKDLTLLFAGGSKAGKEYRSRFRKICGSVVDRILDLAEIDYMVETDREAQAVEFLKKIMPAVNEDMNYAELLGLVGILCKFQRRNIEFENEEDMIHRMAVILQKENYGIAARNVHACRIYSYSVNHAKDKLAQWMQSENTKIYERITGENVYVQMIKANCSLSLQQYEKARVLFQRIAAYYAVRGIVQFQAQCMFGEAVALYSMGERAASLKMATHAITLGTKYRYVGIYCMYGKIGVELIEQYQEMLRGGEVHPARTKKKYYYGNTMKASWEGYQSILLRCAKKKMRQTSSEFEMNKETLTLTELTILQHISNGCSNQEISELMNVKLTTVKTHIYSIYRKMDVSSRVQAINKGKEMGLL